MSDHDHLFTPGGRLHDLTLERFAAEDLSSEEAAWVEAHLATHAGDRQRLAELRSIELQFASLAPPAGLFDEVPDNVVPFGARSASAPAVAPAPPVAPSLVVASAPAAPVAPVVVTADPTRSVSPVRRRWPMWGGTLLAMAAALVLVVRPGSTPIDDPGGIRAKGAGIELEVYVARPDGSHRLASGDPVAPGDRLGFRLGVTQPGYVLVAGVDEAGSAYLCHPQDTAMAVMRDAVATPQVVDDAIRVDDTPGRERLVALRCPAGFSFDDVHDRLVAAARAAGDGELETLIPECGQHEVWLQKDGAE